MSSFRDQSAGGLLRMVVAVIMGMSLIGAIGALMQAELWQQCKCSDKEVSLTLFNVNETGLYVVSAISWALVLLSMGLLVFYDFDGKRRTSDLD